MISSSGVMRSATQLIERSLETRDERVCELARLLREEVDRIERLVGDLLDLARFEAAGITMVSESVAVSELFDRVVERLPIGLQLVGHKGRTPALVQAALAAELAIAEAS